MIAGLVIAGLVIAGLVVVGLGGANDQLKLPLRSNGEMDASRN